MVTMSFIAKKAGLSRYTVSRALSGNSKVLPETRRKILEICEEYGYIPNCNAVGLVKGQTNLIGVAMPYITDDFYSEFIELLDYAAEKRNYQLIYRSSYNNNATETEVIKNFLSLKVCAMIIAPVVVDLNERIHELAGKNIPIVYFDRPWRKDCYHVLNDNHRGVFEMTSALIKAERRPGFLGSFYRESNITACERQRGYCEAMQMAGLPPRVLDCSHSTEKQDNELFGYENVRWIIANQEVPDSLVCVTDAVALGAMRALNNAGIMPGKDVLVTGHDNLRFSEFLTPSLTTIRQRKDLFAQTCISIIDACLADKKPKEKGYVFTPEIIRRESA